MYQIHYKFLNKLASELAPKFHITRQTAALPHQIDISTIEPLYQFARGASTGILRVS